jgi:hypothetical protein
VVKRRRARDAICESNVLDLPPAQFAAPTSAGVRSLGADGRKAVSRMRAAERCLAA